MTPSILDYHSDCPTFSLAFSPLYQETSNLKLAVGSYNDNRGDTNNVTVIELNSNYLDHNDYDEEERGDISDDDNPMDGDYFNKSSRRHSTSKSNTSRTSTSAFNPIARAPHPYPPSAIAFSPARLSSSLQSSTQATKGETTREMLASSSECLRLWDLVGDDNSMESSSSSRSNGFIGSGRSTGSGSRLVQRAVLANSKQDYSAPLTSFSWSTLEPTHIVTSSIDTTCTVWDISTSVPITQLIAHDREVYDVAWSPASREVFASVGADGSVRMFDLRSLEHSTILYEATQPTPPSTSTSSKPPQKSSGTSPTSPSLSSSNSTSTSLPSPLLRLAFSPTSPTYVSVVHADSADVQILDTRNPGTPAMEVRGHKAAVNGMAWGGSTMRGGGGGAGETVGPGWLATCSDDSTILLWDLSTTTPPPPPISRSAIASPKIIMDPVVSYSAPTEVNAIAWGGGGEWVAAGCGRLVRLLKV